MNSKQLDYPLSSLKKQQGDVAVKIVVLIAAVILGYFLWQYIQSSSNEEVTANDLNTDQSLSNAQDQTDTNVDRLKQQQKQLKLDKKNLTSSGSHTGSEATNQDQSTDANKLLPALGDSDVFARKLLSNLSTTPTWRVWLKTAQPIRKFSQFIDNIAHGKVPHKYFRFMAPSGKFKVDSVSDDQYFLDVAAYHRYDSIAKTIDSLDPADVLRVYEMLEPLVESAWGEIKTDQTNEKTHTFDQSLFTAIKNIQSAPAIHDKIQLIRPSVMYKYADPKLERLNSVSKQMIRMGPTNTRIIQKKLDDIEALFKARHNTNISPEQASTNTE